MAPKPERILVWGSGGHGKVIADLVRACGHELRGFVDADPARLHAVAEPGGARVLLLQDDLIGALEAGASLPHGAGAVVLAIGDNGLRLQCARRLGSAAAPALVHPRATVSASVGVGRGSVVCAGAVVNAAAVIGEAAILNTACVVEHDCIVGDGAHVSPGAVLAGAVSVGEGAWVGAHATVIQGLRVGAGAIVGAGAVVIRDVPDGMTVAGVPARRLA